MIRLLSSIFLCLTTGIVFGAELRVQVRAELDVSSLAGLVGAWDLDALQKQQGLPRNLRWSTVQDYLSEDSQLKELPESIQKELTESPFLPEGPVAEDSWAAIVRRWRALPLETKLPLLKVSRFDPDDQARALLETLHRGGSLPALRPRAPEGLKALVSASTFEFREGRLLLRSSAWETTADKAREWAGRLSDAAGPTLKVAFAVQREGGAALAAEMFRLKARVETGKDPIRIGEGDTLEIGGDAPAFLDQWLELARLPEADALSKARESLKAALDSQALEKWSAFVDDKETSLAQLAEWLSYLGPLADRIPESRELARLTAKRVQFRLRPWKILQMSEGTDVRSLLSLIRVSADLLPPGERQIGPDYGVVPLSLEIQMKPDPDLLAESFLLLAPENPQAKKAVLARLRGGEPKDAFPLLARLGESPVADPEITEAAAEAKKRLNWQEPSRSPASDGEPRSEVPDACSLGWNDFASESP